MIERIRELYEERNDDDARVFIANMASEVGGVESARANIIYACGYFSDSAEVRKWWASLFHVETHNGKWIATTINYPVHLM